MIVTVGAWFCLGVDLDARYNHRDEADRLKQSMKGFINSIDTLTYSLPLYKVFPTRFLKNANKALDDSYKIGTEYADQHMARIMEGVSKGEKHTGQSLLEQWLIEGKQTKEEAVKFSTGILAGGLDTVSGVVINITFKIILNLVDC